MMPADFKCILCGGTSGNQLTTPKKLAVVKCGNCRLWALDTPPSHKERQTIYDSDYYGSWFSNPAELASISR